MPSPSPIASVRPAVTIGPPAISHEISIVPPGVCLGSGAVAAKLNAANMAIPNCKIMEP
jgi:hypothetical protein